MSGGTWRRLKIAAEVKLGHQVPAGLPDSELVKLLGLLVLVRDGRGTDAVRFETLQEETGLKAQKARRGAELREACRELASQVDVRPFL